jgi:hypothetical protein
MGGFLQSVLQGIGRTGADAAGGQLEAQDRKLKMLQSKIQLDDLQRRLGMESERLNLSREAAYRQTPEGQLAYLRGILGHEPTNDERQRAAGVAPPKMSTDERKRADFDDAVGKGYKGSYEQWTAEESAKGHFAGAGPAKVNLKPGMSNGKSTFAYYNTEKHSWIDSNTGEKISDFQPQPSFAQTGLWSLDVGYTNDGTVVPVLMNRRNGQIKPVPGSMVAASQSKEIEEARKPAINGDALLKTMLKSQRDAMTGNQQAMLSIVANHIGMTLGAQKGARISQAIWNEAISSAPWIQVQAAKWFHPANDGTGDMIFDGYKSGVNLTPEQVTQMVELAKQRRQILWEQFAQTAAANGVQVQVPEFKEGAEPSKGTPTPPSKGKGTKDDPYVIP